MLLAGSAAAKPAVPTPNPRAVPHTPAKPAPQQPAGDGIDDMTGAVPLSQAKKLPSTQQQYESLKQAITRTKPAVDTAKQKSDALQQAARTLRARLIATVARVQALEQEKQSLQVEIARLTREEKVLARDFDRDRGRVGRLLAVLQRLQHDMPPVIALKSDDALGAARGAMLLGASLPRVYGEAAALARRLETLRTTRRTLGKRRVAAAKNAVQLSAASRELDQLVAIREAEAADATQSYGALQAELDHAADEAANIEFLLAKVAVLRSSPSAQAGGPANVGIAVIGAESGNEGLKRGGLLRPVAGKQVPGGLEGIGGTAAPGLSFYAAPGSHVIAPADARVLFAGPYHKAGYVLILETPGGYDLVLAGLGRVGVRAGDQLLAGEPVGTMPNIGQGSRLYFELRKGGKGTSPAPWLEVDLRKAKRT